MAIISHENVKTRGRSEFSCFTPLTRAPGDRCFPLLCSGSAFIDMHHLPGVWVIVTLAAPLRFQHPVVMVPWTEDETRAEPSKAAEKPQVFCFLHPISVCHFPAWLQRELLCKWGATPNPQFRVLLRAWGLSSPFPSTLCL